MGWNHNPPWNEAQQPAFACLSALVLFYGSSRVFGPETQCTSLGVGSLGRRYAVHAATSPSLVETLFNEVDRASGDFYVELDLIAKNKMVVAGICISTQKLRFHAA